ncbi:MAG: drug/metabolite transporter (DMT)-like permease [Candidatus Azotimanducaceae bacterium]|jgi:drug/metabolite transporter (DMT)-like permease
MIYPQFFVLVGIAVLSWGIQIPLLVKYSRKYDGLIVTVYRNLSLGITMLPVLFFATGQEILSITSVLPTLLLASGFGALAFISNLNMSNYLPVGTGSAIRQSVNVIVAVILGALFLNEFLTSLQLILLAGILAGAITLTFLRSQHEHLDESTVWKGIMLACVAGVGYALSFLFFSILSREISPLVAGYFWELSVGVFALAYLLYKKATHTYSGQTRLPMKDLVPIVLISTTTIAGTLAYGYAVHFGPYALASGLITTTVLIATIAGWILFKEKLSFKQLLAIAFVIALIFILRLTS